MFVCACKPTKPCQNLEGKDCFRDEECGEGGFCSPPGEIDFSFAKLSDDKVLLKRSMYNLFMKIE